MSPDFPRAGFDDEDESVPGPSLSPFDERAIEQEAKLLGMILDFSSRLTTLESSDEVMDQILDAIERLGIAERVFIIMKLGETLEISRHRDPLAGRYREEYAAVSQTVVRDCLEKNEPLYIEDLTRLPRFQSSLSVKELNLRAAVCIPLRNGNEPFGVLYLDSQKPLPQRGRPMRLLHGYALLSSLAISLLRDVEAAKRRADRIQKERDAALARVSGDWARDLIGNSRPWIEVLRQIDVAKDIEHTVLIEGESGTGKELIARAIAMGSPRRKAGPFIALNCAGLDPQLLEATLFGTVKGAFTGAVDRPGYVEAANGGTLFLDEIGDMSTSVQRHFLRFLDNQEFRRLGSLELQTSDVRIVAATNRDLKTLCRQGQFRPDLYNRINHFRIAVPPLRKRLDDVPVLVTHFLELIGRSSVQIDAEALDVMRHYNWPGNVRQLRNAIEIAALTAGDSRVITRADIEQRAGISEDDILLSPPRTLAQARALAERNLTIESHRRHKGDKSKMAEEMEVSRMTIYNLIRRHCLGRDELDGPGTDADNDSHGAERQSV